MSEFVRISYINQAGHNFRDRNRQFYKSLSFYRAIDEICHERISILYHGEKEYTEKLKNINISDRGRTNSEPSTPTNPIPSDINISNIDKMSMEQQKISERRAETPKIRKYHQKERNRSFVIITNYYNVQKR